MKLSSTTYRKRLLLFAAVVFGTAALCMALRFCDLLFFYEAEAGYYRSQAILPTVTAVLQVLSIVALAILALFGFQKNEAPVPSLSGASRWIALLPAVTVVSASVFLFQSNEAATFITALPNASVFFLLSLLFAMVLTVFFALLCLPEQKRAALKVPLLITGLAGLLFFAVRLAIAYFDFSVPMNSPLKITEQIACLAAMLLVLSELRTVCDAQKPRFSLFATGAAVLLLGTASVPSLLALFCGVFSHGYPYTAMDAISFALFVYGVVRLCQICFFPRHPHRTDPAPETESLPHSEETN